MEEVTTNQSLIKEINNPLYQARGWLKFLGVLLIVYGIISALTVIGILFAWVPIWMGVLLFKAGNNTESAGVTGDKNMLLLTLNQLRKYFVIQGVLLLVGVIASVLGLIIAGGSLMGILTGFGN